MIRPNTSVACIFVVYCCCSFPCRGQQLDPIEVPNIKYTDESPKTFYVGDLAQISVAGEGLARAGGVKNLRARLFADTKGRLTSPAEYLREGCLIYPTQVVSILKSTRGIVIQSTYNKPVAFTRDWLNRGADTEGDEQWYVLVLEKDSGEARPGILDETLKLRPADAKAYFQRGFQFILKSRTGIKAAEKQRLREINAAQQAHTQMVFAQAKVMKLDCLGYRSLKLTGLLAPCDCGDETNAIAVTQGTTPAAVVADR